MATVKTVKISGQRHRGHIFVCDNSMHYESTQYECYDAGGCNRTSCVMWTEKSTIHQRYDSLWGYLVTIGEATRLPNDKGAIWSWEDGRYEWTTEHCSEKIVPFRKDEITWVDPGNHIDLPNPGGIIRVRFPKISGDIPLVGERLYIGRFGEHCSQLGFSNTTIKKLLELPFNDLSRVIKGFDNAYEAFQKMSRLLGEDSSFVDELSTSLKRPRTV